MFIKAKMTKLVLLSLISRLSSSYQSNRHNKIRQSPQTIHPWLNKHIIKNQDNKCRALTKTGRNIQNKKQSLHNYRILLRKRCSKNNEKKENLHV